MADESWRKLTPSQIEEKVEKMFPKKPEHKVAPSFSKEDPLSKLPEDVRALRTTQVPTVEEREEAAKMEMKKLELPAEDDEFGEEFELEVGEDEIDDVEEVAAEVMEDDVIELEDLPSDEEVKMQMEEDEGRLAGLAEDAVIEEDAKDDEKEDVAEEEEKEEDGDEWDGDHNKLLGFIMKGYGRIPRHRGTILGCQRAHCFLKNLLDVLSKGLRSDLKGQISEDDAENMRIKILKDMAALDDRVSYLSDKKFASEDPDMEKTSVIINSCEKCGTLLWKNASGEDECLVCNGKGIEKDSKRKDDMKKEAATATIQLIASPFVHGVASVIINSKVSGGKDVEKVFKKMAEKYGMNERERFEVIHLLSQMGFPLYLDRGRIGEGNYDHTDGEGVDWLTNYNA